MEAGCKKKSPLKKDYSGGGKKMSAALSTRANGTELFYKTDFATLFSPGD